MRECNAELVAAVARLQHQVSLLECCSRGRDPPQKPSPQQAQRRPQCDAAVQPQPQQKQHKPQRTAAAQQQQAQSQQAQHHQQELQQLAVVV